MSPTQEARTVLKQFPSLDQHGIASLLGLYAKELRHSIGHHRNPIQSSKSKCQFKVL
jgi:hypothetical protein